MGHLEPNGKLRSLSAKTGDLRATWNIGWNGEPAVDVDVFGGNRTGDDVAFRAVEPPIYHNPFGAPPHPELPEPPYRITWEGSLEAPLTDEYVFEALKARDESITVWIDGELLLDDSGGTRASGKRRLTAAHRYALRILYQNDAGRPELELLWWASNLDKSRVPADLLYQRAETRGS